MQKYAEFGEKLIRLGTKFVVLHAGTDLRSISERWNVARVAIKRCPRPA